MNNSYSYSYSASNKVKSLMNQVIHIQIVILKTTNQLNTYSMRQPDLYYFETIKMKSLA